MRIQFIPPNERAWLQVYQHGGSMPLFVGQPYQTGAGLGSIFRGLLKFLMPAAKSAGKAIGREALSTGAKFD